MTGMAPERQQRLERRARVQVARALLAVLQRQQHLRHGHVAGFEQLLVGMRQADLADRSCRLALLQAQRSRGQPQVPPTQRDGARGHQHHLLPAAVQAQQVIDQRFQPGAVQAPGPGVDQQRRTDLDDDAPCGRQWRG